MKQIINEAFSISRGDLILKKFFKVLQRKTHKKINYSEFPMKYKNKWGKFAGFLFTVGTNNKKLYRINFSLTETSYNFSSYDVFVLPKTQIPNYTIDLEGLNIIQTLDILVNDSVGSINDSEFILESITSEGMKLQEKGTYNKSDYALARLEKFANAKEVNIKNLQAKPLSDVYNDYVNWETDPDALPFYIFTKTAKMFLVKRGMTNKTFRKRKKGSRERVIEDESLNLQFQQEIEDIGWEEKFEMLEAYLDMISNASAQSLIITGSPGCLTGDMEIKVNRRRNSSAHRVYDLEYLYEKFNGMSRNGKYWDLAIPTKIMSYNPETTMMEYNEVIGVVHSGVKKVFEVITESGRKIKTTGEHRFLINKEGDFKKLEDISVGEFVALRSLKRISFARGRQEGRKIVIEKIISIIDKGMQDTYDIQMKAPLNSFEANGFVVHNSGKTEHTMSYFKRNKVEIHLFKGGVKGVNEVVRILYKYRDNAIIVFDDCDVLLHGKETNGIMKAALDNSPVREVTWVLDKNMDKNPKSKNYIPPRFQFTSGIVFISNETNFDAAIRSRSLNVEINLTNTEMIDKMTKTAAKFHPEIGMKEKLEVLEYLQEVASGVRAIDYRGFEAALMLRIAMPTKWKKWTLMNLMQM